MLPRHINRCGFCHVCGSDGKYNETSATTTKVPHRREQHCLEAPMISEYDFQRKWKLLFNGDAVRKETVRKARNLVNRLSYESPLRVRFGKDLDDIEAIVDHDGT